MVARFYEDADKRVALLDGSIIETDTLPVILENWDILPPSWEHLTAGDRLKYDVHTCLIQAVNGVGNLAVVLMVAEKNLVATTPLTIAELKKGGYTPLPYAFLPKPDETVEVGGKTYRKADVEKALEGVKAVGK